MLLNYVKVLIDNIEEWNPAAIKFIHSINFFFHCNYESKSDKNFVIGAM